MSKHTPGPWEVAEFNRGVGVMGPDGAHGLSGLSPIIAEVNIGNSGGDTGANARLIAAAPELLEDAAAALQFLKDDSRSPRRRNALIQSLEATIAKAKGE